MLHTVKRFHTLDALRFLAFLKVFFLHLPDVPAFETYSFLKQGGGTGVALFFVLSGFLISDILLKQKLKYSAINARTFFVRRALRIWPLYFLGVAIAFLGIQFTSSLGISDSNGYMPTPWTSLLFVENYRMIWEASHPRGVPLNVFWSLCIEEHFYLLWLAIFVFVPIKYLFRLFVLLFIAGISFRLLALVLLPGFDLNGAEILTSLDYFAVGALIAYVLHFAYAKTTAFVSIPVRVFVLCIALLFMIIQHVFYHQLGVFAISLTALVYGALIAVFIFGNSTSYTISDAHWLSKWGRLSYGLYVFHTPVILVLLMLFKYMSLPLNNAPVLIVFILASFLITLAIAAFVYTFYERYFLKLRERYFNS